MGGRGRGDGVWMEGPTEVADWAGAGPFVGIDWSESGVAVDIAKGIGKGFGVNFVMLRVLEYVRDQGCIGLKDLLEVSICVQ